MRVTLTRSGGVGGLRLSFAIDAGGLSPPEARELEGLLAAAGFWASPPQVSARAAAPDRFRYRLCVEDGPRRHEVLAAEEAMPAPLRALVRWVEGRARPTPAGKRRHR